jgi:site-specific recombinase XerD
LVSTHTMRRTAISTLLNLGVDENYVRKISGHSAGSKEFYKYVKYGQKQMDDAVAIAFEKLAEK